ncbi:MAG: hypothetical protein M0P57_07140 [Syntrophales bacterium]|jgi:predicted Fe-Mo cluster-binding NifX family protein|nr:hypothetical protein [Syntrophales bacterium]MDY0043823.1 NifB/NifX family molybdenum-iron cluster-binding protein [Syntrophales bacterium]
MKAAFAQWENRIAPVFDVAHRFYIIEIDSGQVIWEAYEELLYDLPVRKVSRLVELGIEVLVCGAISRPLHEMVRACGIQVIPFVAGDLVQVMRAWLSDRLDGDVFAMPGCMGRGRRGRLRMNGTFLEEKGMMRGRQGRKMGAGRGQNQGGRPGRTGGAGEGPAGYCRCPRCGYREPHERAMPCFEKKCPECGAVMTRE